MFRDEIIGHDACGPLLDGRWVPYVNLDNAATTPPLRAVVEAVEDFLPMASSVHRGTGHKSRLSTEAFEQARDVVHDFVGADADRDVVIFTKNTTEAINRYARTMTMASDGEVLTTVLEHHSNLLPWRRRGTVVHMRAHADGSVDEEDLDDAHKMYAPYGAGALIAGRNGLGDDPDECGGGTVRAVTLDRVVWADLPDRTEAGSPNLLGVVAFAAALRRLREIGMASIAAHEHELAVRLRARLRALDRVTIVGPPDADLGVVSFVVAGVDPRLVAAILGYEHGIGVRSGCFCAQPYVHHLLRLSSADIARWVDEAARGDLRRAPGLVRISLGGYSDWADVDRAVQGLRQIVAGEIAGSYRQGPDGTFTPRASRHSYS